MIARREEAGPLPYKKAHRYSTIATCTKNRVKSPKKLMSNNESEKIRQNYLALRQPNISYQIKSGIRGYM